MNVRRVATAEQQALAIRRWGVERAGVELRRRGLQPSIQGGAGWVFQRAAAATISVTSGTASLGTTGPATGNVLVIAMEAYATSATIATPTDTYGNTYIQYPGLPFNANAANTATMTFYWCINKGGSGQNTVNVSWTNTTFGGEVHLGEFTPPAGTIGTDGTVGTFDNGGNNVTTVTSPSIITSSGNSLVICYTTTGNPTTITSGDTNGWAQMTVTSGDSSYYTMNRASGTTSANFTESAGLYAAYICALGSTFRLPYFPRRMLLGC